MKHWQLNTDADRILWLTINRQDTSVNSINREVLEELKTILTQVTDELPAGLILLSGKPKGFVAGADITQFTTIKTATDAFDLVRQAQTVFDQLAALPIPTVAMIRGFCLGGGLELALACRYRIAEESLATKLGLPEVKLGLHPGWGGTVRLPRLIGAPLALDMMLKGKIITAGQAAKWGVIDASIPERYLEKAARFYVLNKPSPHKPKGLARWSHLSWVRPWIGRYIEKTLTKKVDKSHYPAPFAILERWVKEGAQGEQAYINEAHSIAELMVGDTSRQLVRAFFLQTDLKSLAKKVTFKPRHVHVVGAGAMGGDIAAWCAYKGFSVTLQDQTAEQIAPAIERAHQLFKKKFDRPRLVEAALDRLQPDVAGFGVAQADIVIEAIIEDLSAKKELFKTLLPRLKKDAVLASNTSSIPLQDIATVLKNPEQLVGLHFFNPVAKMPLVEVVHSDQTSQTQMDKAICFATQLGHYPVPVVSAPGFLVNRILMPYLIEAILLQEEGIPMTRIDQAAKTFGMPMGPIELADAVGLDVCLSVARILGPVFGYEVPAVLQAQVDKGHLGKKSGEGFYRYDQRNWPLTVMDEAVSQATMTDRLILRLCNEAVACLADKIVDSADFLDAAMIYGIGFAPFRGGPMQYIQSMGAKTLQKKLLQFSEQYGERFKPHEHWSAL